MIDPTWRRIAGLHIQEDGDAGVVWLAWDQMADVIHLYDAAIFRREVLAVIAEGISARGRWIPVGWHKDAAPFVEKLLDRGINTLPEPCADSQSTAEVVSREVWQRMRSSRFRVDQRVGEWLAEFNTFYRDESKVPREGFPLMAATRHAIEMLQYARAQSSVGSKRPNYVKVAIV